MITDDNDADIRSRAEKYEVGRPVNKPAQQYLSSSLADHPKTEKLDSSLIGRYVNRSRH